jgi:hypothetical protein
MSRSSRIRIPVLIAALPMFLVTAAAHAQSRNTGTLTGIVLDEVGKPVPGVEVAVANISRTTRTDSAGKFMLALMPVGSHDVAFRRVSYAPMMFILEITRGDTTEAEVKMNAVAQEMRAIRVEEHPEHVRDLGGFEDRRRAGIGHYITRQQIEDRNPQVMSDMFRMMPGTTLINTGLTRSALRFTRAQGKGRDCPPTYFIDGTMAHNYNIDDMPVSDVEAVEVYSGISTLPAAFAKARSTINCGTVVIWTRIPGNTKKPPK